jgi:hypothetical protein
MDLRVVGAGLGRTGTASLKLALERLLGGPSYHMLEVFGHPEHIPLWQAAAEGEATDWDAILDGYVSAVDWPPCAFWQELADANPDSVVLLSRRSSAEAWWQSASTTILPAMAKAPADDPWRIAVEKILRRNLPYGWADGEAALRGYNDHLALVRAECPPERLLEWQPGDGWEPLCERLGLPVPDDDFPHENKGDDFRKMAGL